ncbi:M3 family metallopeptidase [Flavobacterium sp. HSC-61S13]|uniref:M3 family metallopeptidase n=1 Tax=Flavobacterium sp. HSC-61S13 TaxID=2910963 RepID=UPI00209DFF07|nr:M3 family metallopeptidase [Flavobacterium sp. HSC-61S13]MCP1995413.1 peptidyl-dipeptidase Dcp [Flavobacterium sp. HSC-61S13]
MNTNFRSIIILTLIAASTLSCKRENTAYSSGENNPLMATWETPFEVPPFDEIDNKNFETALSEGIKDQQEEIDDIIKSKSKLTFENTIVAFENSGLLLDRISSVFYNLLSANTNDDLQATAIKMAPILSEHQDNIYLNADLFKRIQLIWEAKEALKLNQEQRTLLEKTYKKFVRNGALLQTEEQKDFRAINQQLALTSLQFGDNLLADSNAYALEVSDKKDLAGLPQDLMEAAAAEAKARGKENKWVFTLNHGSVIPFLQYAENRTLRKTIWEAYQHRANQDNKYDNKKLVIELANLRMQRAQLLGYKNHASYVLEENMAKNPETVYQLLDKLWNAAQVKTNQEEQDIQKLLHQDGITGNVQPYDWRFYTEKIRKSRFDFDENALKPYLSLPQVQQGVFDVATKLYGLQFTALPELPKYHKDVTTWQVTEKDGTLVGILYLDFFARSNKKGGAWMTSFRKQQTRDGKRIAPIISIVCNFSKSTDNAPALLTFEETTTVFHEFGHALHGLLSNVNYRSLAGTNVPRDFVELPSQILENWAAQPSVLKQFAKHYKTGESIPTALIEKLQKAQTFNQGFATTEYLAASLLDMKYHTQTQEIDEDVNAFESKLTQQLKLTNAIIPRYRSTYFMHLFAGGYASGYYSYIWSEVLDSDAFEAFKSNGLFDAKTAQSFRKNILEKGGTEDPLKLYFNFRGHEPNPKALLAKRGL